MPLDPEQPNKTFQPPAFRLLTVAEVEALPPTEYLVETFLPEKSIGVLHGQPGSCKTFVALDWAMSIGTGTPWLGHKVKRGDVVYVAAEGSGGLGKRLRAWKQRHQGLETNRIFFLTQPIQLHDPEQVGGLIRAVKEAGIDPEGIVFDTLARNFGGGDENTAKDMGQLIAGCDRIKKELSTALLLIHHSTKNGESLRGSGALQGAADVVIMSVKKGAHSRTLTLSCDKQKDDEPFPDTSLTLEDVDLGNGESSCVLVAGVLSVGSVVGGSSSFRPLVAKLAGFTGSTATAKEFKTLIGGAESTARRRIAEAVAAGEILQTGSGKKTIYSLPPTAPSLAQDR